MSQVSQASQTPKMSTNRYQTEELNTETMCLNASQPSRPYSDYLLNGVPISEIENRGMIIEEAEAFKEEVGRLCKRDPMEL